MKEPQQQRKPGEEREHPEKWSPEKQKNPGQPFHHQEKEKR
jgi:hypothetical protein